jgi:hypothetical protein
MPETIERRMLRYDFSVKEHEANCAEMARLLGERDEMEITHKQIKTGLKEQAEALEANLSRHGRFVRDKCDHRDTECRWMMNTPKVGEKTLVRTDTGELVEERRMEDWERQESLKLDPDDKIQ